MEEERKSFLVATNLPFMKLINMTISSWEVSEHSGNLSTWFMNVLKSLEGLIYSLSIPIFPIPISFSTDVVLDLPVELLHQGSQ